MSHASAGPFFIEFIMADITYIISYVSSSSSPNVTVGEILINSFIFIVIDQFVQDAPENVNSKYTPVGV